MRPQKTCKYQARRQQKSTTFILDRTKNSMITSQDNTGKNSQVPHITHAYTIVDTIEPTTELPQEHIGNLDHIMQPESSRTASTITMSPSTTTPTHPNPTLRVKNNESSVSILLANVQSLRNKKLLLESILLEDSEYDIVCLDEHHLTRQEAESFAIKNYDVC
ncbi:hypothetical protein JTB14_013134 [Gonioctena quinquepunctata]|nr:hypothetical protein JTB14_013134 [Gonioctena quinquepunctata]